MYERAEAALEASGIADRVLREGASRAMAAWTSLTVVPRSSTTAEMETFISVVSTTRTNIAIASRMASRGFHSPSPPAEDGLSTDKSLLCVPIRPPDQPGHRVSQRFRRMRPGCGTPAVSDSVAAGR